MVNNNPFTFLEHFLVPGAVLSILHGFSQLLLKNIFDSIALRLRAQTLDLDGMEPDAHLLAVPT